MARKSLKALAGFITPKDLPGTLCAIAEEIGIEASLAIADEFSGMQLYLPEWPKNHKPYSVNLTYIVESIGESHAMRLCELFGSSSLDIPSCEALLIKMRNQRIFSLVQKGVKRRDISREFNITERRVRQIVAKRRS